MSVKRINATRAVLFIAAAILSAGYTSCNAGGLKTKPVVADTIARVAEPLFDATLPKGKVTDSIACKNKSDQYYALYLPSCYSADKPFPCIVFFDAHARGALPVTAYKDLAEKYGFVLIGSDVSKNGTPWPVTNEGVQVLLTDIGARINIDPKRVYASGFSGGARVAASVAIEDGGIAGVIGCAAGFPVSNGAFHNRFAYFGLAGDDDFNLVEMEQLDEQLAQNGFVHQLLTFRGRHGWPTSGDYEMALLWMQVQAMKENLQPKNATWITKLQEKYNVKIKEAVSGHNLIAECCLLQGMLRILDGLANMSAVKNQLEHLLTSQAFKKEADLQMQLRAMEAAQQKELATQYAQHDGTWWKHKIAIWTKNAHSAATMPERQMNQRLLSYLGLVAYLNTSHALKAGDLDAAASGLALFKMADPVNPDGSYLTAILCMEKGDRAGALSALNKAALSGYSEVLTLRTEKAFAGLQVETVFKKIVDKVVSNGLPQ